jgi:uncharacterized membrane protein
MITLRSLRLAAIALHALLIAGLIAWSTTVPGLALSALLLLPLPGFVRDRLYTFRWSTLLVPLYSAVLLADGYARPDERLSAFALGFVAALDFVSLVLYVRLRGRALAAQTAG